MEVTSKFQKFWKGYLRKRSIATFVFILPLFSVPDPKVLLEFGGIAFVLFTTTVIAEILEQKHGYLYSETLLVLGMPMGMVGVANGLVGVFGAYSETTIEIDVAGIGISAYFMLMTIMYGILTSAVGFVLADKNASVNLKLPISLPIFCLTFFIFCSMLAIALSFGPGFSGTLSRFPVILTGGLIIAFVLARKNTGLAENLADASLATIVMGITISIVTLYSNFGPSSDYNFIEPHVFFQNTNYANYCLLYGASLYVLSFLLSLRTNEVSDINFIGKNWHMLEAFSFYVFMTLAAPSVFELV